jgi:hypothetical protein
MTAYAPRPGPTRPRCGWPQAPRHLTPRWSSGQREATPASPVLKPCGAQIVVDDWFARSDGRPRLSAREGDGNRPRGRPGQPPPVSLCRSRLSRGCEARTGLAREGRGRRLWRIRGWGRGRRLGSVGRGSGETLSRRSLTEQEHDSFLVNDEAPPLRRGLSSVSGDGLLVPVEVAAHKRGHERHESGRSDQGLRLHRSLLSGVGPSDSEPRSLRARLAARGLRPCLCCIRRREAVFVG